MSNPTTPFSWQMPTATDLVTDLPADFEVFGQAVATSMADLLGGTTGQVLSKTTNADMDFTWVAANPGDITAVTAGTGISGGGTSGAVTITNDMATTITAAGDIVVGTGSGTYDNLPIGTTAQVLTADTTVSPYKVKWATAAGGGKLLQLTSTQITSYVQVASTTMTDTNITASITPTSATSKILVTITACIRINANTPTNLANSKFSIVRGATTIVSYLDGRFFQLFGTGHAQITVQYLDSPATTSATTYKAQGAVDSTADGRYVEFQLSSYPSTITLMEIGA